MRNISQQVKVPLLLLDVFFYWHCGSREDNVPPCLRFPYWLMRVTISQWGLAVFMFCGLKLSAINGVWSLGTLFYIREVNLHICISEAGTMWNASAMSSSVCLWCVPGHALHVF
jgi:hypothetical protein